MLECRKDQTWRLISINDQRKIVNFNKQTSAQINQMLKLGYAEFQLPIY